MEQARADMEGEIEEMEKEAADILADIKSTIGDLSDLRYGRFNKPAGTGEELGREVLDSLRQLKKVCDSSAMGG